MGFIAAVLPHGGGIPTTVTNRFWLLLGETLSWIQPQFIPRIIESKKRPPRSPSPTTNPSPPCPLTTSLSAPSHSLNTSRDGDPPTSLGSCALLCARALLLHGPLRIIETNFWLHTGSPQIQILCLIALSKLSLNSSSSGPCLLPCGACSMPTSL